MNNLVNRLILFNNSKEHNILTDVSDIFKCLKVGNERDCIISDINSVMSKLLSVAVDYGISGNIWHGYISLVLLTSDNAFTRMFERRKITNSSLCDFAKDDISILYDLFNYDFAHLEDGVKHKCFTRLESYKKGELSLNVRYKGIADKLNEFTRLLENSSDCDDFYNNVVDFYAQYGFGDFGLNRAFALGSGLKLTLRPVNDMQNVLLSDIVGYDQQKQQLLANTRAFVEGKIANNVLLYGDSGTGKSTSIKAIVNGLYTYGLRMIEIHKHQIGMLSDLISELKHRNYRFIIYMDDLSFDENENEYKYLKALIEGGVETKPDNVLIYATSNRRHLVKENWSDRDSITVRNDVHSSDTLEEKLSLAARFGLTIYYPKPARSEYSDIVIELAHRAGIEMDDDELRNMARVWEMHHGGISGRTAKQFITHLLSEQY